MTPARRGAGDRTTEEKRNKRQSFIQACYDWYTGEARVCVSTGVTSRTERNRLIPARPVLKLRLQYLHYNNVLRAVLKKPRRCSASEIFADARLDDFYAIIRKCACCVNDEQAREQHQHPPHYTGMQAGQLSLEVQGDGGDGVARAL
ncbi:jg18525 [Pararge aegeria aegeria]|uniref:Jg18525 protein n=1 Tax=Pararge aegeria aegeria TaxID=348720 RepID=A0A8S4RZ77_9NEOP|nr:jg18525 [Pararge aegeria aegeria]